MSDSGWQKIEDIFHRALELAPDARSAFLDQACRSDPSLRREVESLLANESENGSTFAHPAEDGAPQTIAHYRILGKLGQGGMGAVYRATDTKLGREVAIKVLPPFFAEDPDRLARFTREAKVLASLNHPNIAQIYGIEESNGVRALVMELVPGETLASHLKRGPLPLETALNYAKQIAEAFEAAHEKGIIHRDLKPANVMVTPEGVAKVLDFGLAAVALDSSSATGDPMNSPTLTMRATQAGTIMGTAAYMSPEQASGKPVDRRADIWSFGVVLFEMLTGKRLFGGETVSHTLADVLRGPIDFDQLPRGTPAAIRGLLRRCLERNVRNRLQAIGDARIFIEEVLSGSSQDAPPVPQRHNLTLAVVGVALALIVVVALWAPRHAEKPVDRLMVRLDVDLGADTSLPPPSIGGSNVAISPDGMRLVYASGAPTKLFTRLLDQSKTTELPGTQGANRPFFSPDSQWVGFMVGSRLNKIAVDGGAIVPLGDIGNFTGASWGENGRILVSNAFGKGLLWISASGGQPEPVMGLGNGDTALVRPQILPGGKAILFGDVTTAVDRDRANIEVLTLADRHRKIVARGGTSPRYLATSSATGHLVYVNKATLFAIPFDLERLETRGTAVPVLDDISFERVTGSGQLDFSSTGTMVYRRAGGGASPLMMLQWVDPSGRKEPLRAKPGVYQYPNLSPDGKLLALTVTEQISQDVWVYDLQRDTMTRLTFGDAFYLFPIWSPDGKYVVFSSYTDGLFQARADGTSQPQALMQNKNFPIPWSFAPDGKRLAYVESGQIWTVLLEDQGGQLKAGKPQQFLNNTFNSQAPSFSPDGRWLAYQSNESGKNEIYVRAFPPSLSGQGGKWQISNNGGRTPRWSRNRPDLLYQAGDQILAASYTMKGDTFVAEKPRAWIAEVGGLSWDPAPDGKRVVVLTPMQAEQAPKQDHEIVFLENFFDYLRRRVPSGK